MRRFSIPAISIVILVVAGCGKSGPQTAKVTGTVSIDGESVKLGTITFMHPDGTTPSSGAEIRDGSYLGEIYVGPMNVRISYPKVTGKKKAYDAPDAPYMNLTTEMIPDQFNQKSKLKVEVKEGNNVLDFPLKSKS